MSDIISAISGQFSKSLIMGALLPAAIFSILGLIFIEPLIPDSTFFFQPLEFFDPGWQILLLSLFILILGGLLYGLTSPIIRFFEGYPWINSHYGRWRTRVYQHKYDVICSRYKAIYQLRDYKDKDDEFKSIKHIWGMISLRLNQDFPDKRHLVLPTHLGNVIRSFERYPAEQYGMDSIVLWPHLTAILSDRELIAIADAKSTLTFFLSLSILSFFLSWFILFFGLLSLPEGLFLKIILPALIFLIFSELFYMASFRPARVWGSLFRSAFDLHHLELLMKLGMITEAIPILKERNLSEKISQQMLFGDSYQGKGNNRIPRVAISNTKDPMLNERLIKF